MDKTAINYNEQAQTEDGSCLYCDSSRLEFLVNYNYGRDTSSNCPFVDEYVIRAEVTSFKSIYTGNACKALGFGAEGDCVNYYHNARLINLTDTAITFSGLLTIIYSENGIIRRINYTVEAVDISPFSYHSVENIGIACNDDNAFFNLIVDNPTFFYH